MSNKKGPYIEYEPLFFLAGLMAQHTTSPPKKQRSQKQDCQQIQGGMVSVGKTSAQTNTNAQQGGNRVLLEEKATNQAAKYPKNNEKNRIRHFHYLLKVSLDF